MIKNLNAQERKAHPIVRGVLDYFPDALMAVAELSKVGNDQHNPGEPLHWAKEKSTDQEDALVRHLLDRGTFDTDGIRHSAKVAWRALALLQLELEAAQKVMANQEPSVSVEWHGEIGGDAKIAMIKAINDNMPDKPVPVLTEFDPALVLPQKPPVIIDEPLPKNYRF